MHVELSPEVKTYLSRKHKDILEVYCRHIPYTKFGAAHYQLEIHFEKPETFEVEKFTTVDVEGFRVYIESDLIDDQHDIMIKLKEALGFKHLEVEGIKEHP